MPEWTFAFHRKRVEDYNVAVLAGMSAPRAAAEVGSLIGNLKWSALRVGIKLLNPRLVKRDNDRSAIARLLMQRPDAKPLEISRVLKIPVRTVNRHLTVLRPVE